MTFTLFSRVRRNFASLVSLFRPPPKRQVAALVWRRTDAGDVEVLTITTRRTKRWTTPKGWSIKGLTSAGAAAQEAWEEAGVRGDVSETPLGSYLYQKNPGKHAPPNRINVTVFPLEMTAMEDSYPEAGQRKRVWRSTTEAAKLVAEPDLAAIITAFRP